VTLDTGTNTATPAPSGGGDFLEALRTQAIAAGHAAAATPSPEVTPAVEPDGPAPESPSAAPAEPQPPDSGPPAAVEGQAPSPEPSAPITDRDAAFWAQKHGVDLAKLKESLPPEQYASLEAAFRASTETNNRAAQLAKAKQEEAAPETHQAEPAPAPEPAEAPLAVDPADIQTLAAEQLKAHPEVPQLSSQYDQLEASVNKTIETLKPLLQERAELQVLVNSSRVDEITKEEAQQRLREIGADITGLEVKHMRLTQQRDAVVQRYLAVKAGVEGAIRESRESEARATQQAHAFVNVVKTTLNAEVQALIDAKTILPEDRDVVTEQVRLRLAGNLDAPDDPVRFTKEAVQATVKSMDEFHRRRARQYAATKVADAGSIAGTAPNAAATTPTTQPKDLESHLDSLRLHMRRSVAAAR